MIKQIVLFVYVFIALTGISISIRHHWQGASGSNNSMAKHNSRLAPIYPSERLSINK
jgi:hypothetical protein